MTLSNKQRLFTVEYLKSFNATQAAIAAGYSEDTAYSQGSRLLKHVEVRAYVEAFLHDHAMSAAEVLYHLTDIVRSDIADVGDALKDLDFATAQREGKTRRIKKLKHRSITTEDSDISEVEVEMYDQVAALNLLAKYHNLTNTSTVKIDDWQSQAIEDIKAGRIAYEALADAFDPSLAASLFARAGKPVQVGASAEEE